ncbi:MAG: hypothetical protein HYZ47_02665 [Simkania negevensis]|nr:hypothetical protein [Simkania negevensis]
MRISFFLFLFLALNFFLHSEGKVELIYAKESLCITNLEQLEKEEDHLLYIDVKRLEEMIREGNIVLKANKDIVFSSSFLSKVWGRGMTLKAGGSIIFEKNACLSLNRGNFHANNKGKFLMKQGASIATQGGEVMIEGASLLFDSSIDAGRGKIHIYGKGGESQECGLMIKGTSKIITKGNGEIFLTGKGGNHLEGNYGLLIEGEGLIECEDGKLFLFGQGGGNDFSSDNQGIHLSKALIRTKGRGKITIEGRGGFGQNRNEGIFLSENGKIETSQGSIALIGTGRALCNENQGIHLEKGSHIISHGKGSIELRGAGGNGKRKNQGILLSGPRTSLVNKKGGLFLIGFGGGQEGYNPGIHLQEGASISSLEEGSISLEGTGGGSFSEQSSKVSCNEGILVERGKIFSKKGNILLKGKGGKGNLSNHGISLLGTKLALHSEEGEISLQGSSGEGESRGVYLTDENIISADLPGNIKVISK